MVDPNQLAKKLFDSYFCVTHSNIKHINTQSVIDHIEGNLTKLCNNSLHLLNYNDAFDNVYVTDRLDEIVEVLEMVYFEERASQDCDPSGIRFPVEFIIKSWLIQQNYIKIMYLPNIIHSKVFTYIRPKYYHDMYLTDRGEDAINSMIKILNEIGIQFSDETDIV